MEYTLLAVGLILGAAVVWLFLRGKIALAEATGRAASDVDRAALSEQLKSARQQVDATQSLLDRAREDSRAAQAQVLQLERQRSQLLERAARLSEVERANSEAIARGDDLKSEIAKYRERLGSLNADVEGKQKQIDELHARYGELATQHTALMETESQLRATIAGLKATMEEERKVANEKLALLMQAREELTNHFKALANEILEDKTKKFTDQNQTNLAQLLNPLKEKITAFQTKVEEVYINESKDRTALGEQVRVLSQMNATLSRDAQNLTLALKGDRKALGDFGEIILEDVLEKAGLVRGEHYDVQGSEKREDGSRVIPDIVVRLPGDRSIVIDSKMTLPDYRAFASSDHDSDRLEALGRYLKSIRTHMRGLSDKEYQKLYGLKSLDFVIMFIPVEPAFLVAVTNDREVFQDGWQRNVLLVSPSTLLFVIRTVANLWRQEDISRNAQEISNRGAELYDKLVGFIEELERVGERLRQARESYEDARKKLCEGRGNAVRQAEMLKKLGVKPSKSLPAAMVNAEDDQLVPGLDPELQRKLALPIAKSNIGTGAASN